MILGQRTKDFTCVVYSRIPKIFKDSTKNDYHDIVDVTGVPGKVYRFG